MDMLVVLRFTIVIGLSCLVGVPSLAQDTHSGRGLEVVELPTGSVLATAGVRVGDRLVRGSWHGDDAIEYEGAIETFADWAWWSTELAPRGGATLTVERDGREIPVEVPGTVWQAGLLPPLGDADREYADSARQARDRGAHDVASRLWRQLAEAVDQPDVAALAWLEHGQAVALGAEPERALAAFDRAAGHGSSARARLAIELARGWVLRRLGRPDAARRVSPSNYQTCL
ncbi:MAG: hypothetical protein AAGD38_21215 [Acidobacteriota bacterium]